MTFSSNTISSIKLMALFMHYSTIISLWLTIDPQPNCPIALDQEMQDLYNDQQHQEIRWNQLYYGCLPTQWILVLQMTNTTVNAWDDCVMPNLAWSYGNVSSFKSGSNKTHNYSQQALHRSSSTLSLSWVVPLMFRYCQSLYSWSVLTSTNVGCRKAGTVSM